MSRKIWIPPPDNEMIRVKLLEILESIDAALTEKYPLPIDFEEAVISHITAIKEERALPILLKITQLDISDYQSPVLPGQRNKAVIVGQAIEALLEISEGRALPEVQHFISIGIGENYQEDSDNFAVIRYHLIRGLQHCSQSDADNLLKIGKRDPHKEVKAFAVEISKERKRR